MANNLEVGIKVNAETVRAQLAVAQNGLKELTAAAKTASAGITDFAASTEEQKAAIISSQAALQAQKDLIAGYKSQLAAATEQTGEGGFKGAVVGAAEGLTAMGERAEAITTMMRGLGEAVFAAFAVDRIGEFIGSAVELGSSLQHMSEETGISVSALSVLRTQAKLNEVDFASLEAMLRKLSVSAEEAVQKAGNQRDAYAALGISTQELVALHGDTLGLLLRVATAMKGVATTSDLLAVSQQILGRNSMEAIRFLRELGTEGFDGAKAKAQELGTYYTADFAEASERAERATREFEAVLESIKTTLAALVLPSVTDFLREVRDLLTWNTSDAGLLVMEQSLREGERQAKLLKEKVDETAGAVGTLGQFWHQMAVDQLAATEKANAQLREQIRLKKEAAEPAAATGGEQGNKDAGAGIVASMGESYADARQELQNWINANVVGLQDVTAIELNYWKQRIASGKLSSEAVQEAQSQVFSLTRQLRKQDLEETVADLRQQETAAAGNSARVLELKRQEADAIIGAYGRESSEGKNAERDYLEAVTKSVAETNALKQKQATDNIELLNKQLSAGLQHDEALYEQGQISASQRQQAETLLVQQITAAETKLIDDLQQLYATNSKDWQALEDRKKQITEQAGAEIQKINDQHAKAVAQEWQQALKPIESGFNTMFHTLLSGHNTFKQSVLAGERQMANEMIAMAEKVVEDKLAGYLADALGFTEGETAKQTAQTVTDNTGLAQIAEKVLKSIASYAAETFGGVFAFFSGELGPAAAAPAAASEAAVLAAGNMVGFEVGALSIPQTMPAILHAGEMVVPASFNQALQHGDITLGGPGAGDGTSASATNVNLGINVAALDGPSVQRLLYNQRRFIIGMVRDGMNLQKSARPSY